MKKRAVMVTYPKFWLIIRSRVKIHPPMEIQMRSIVIMPDPRSPENSCCACPGKLDTTNFVLYIVPGTNTQPICGTQNKSSFFNRMLETVHFSRAIFPAKQKKDSGPPHLDKSTSSRSPSVELNQSFVFRTVATGSYECCWTATCFNQHTVGK